MLNCSGTILVVEDEPTLLRLNIELLQQHSYQAFAAQTGKHALEILEEKSVDMVLSDVIMTTMNGIQLANIVQQKYPSVEIQFISGFSDETSNSRIDEKLRQCLLQKAVTTRALLERVNELLNSE